MLKRTFIAMAFVLTLTVLPAGANYVYAGTKAPAKPANELSVKASVALDGKVKGTVEYKRNIWDNLALTGGVSGDTKGKWEAMAGVIIKWK